MLFAQWVAPSMVAHTLIQSCQCSISHCTCIYGDGLPPPSQSVQTHNFRPYCTLPYIVSSFLKVMCVYVAYECVNIQCSWMPKCQSCYLWLCLSVMRSIQLNTECMTLYVALSMCTVCKKVICLLLYKSAAWSLYISFLQLRGVQLQCSGDLYICNDIQ